LAVGAGAAYAQHVDPHASAVVVQTAETRRADLAIFRNRFLSADRAYSDAARAEAERRVQALDAAAGEISQAYFELEIARVVALADNGTAFFAGPRSRRYNRVEVRLAPFVDGFYVLLANERDADLLGARLVAIAGQPIEEVRAVARTLGGGTPEFRDRFANYFFESPEQLHALGVIADPTGATYRFLTADGRAIERRLEVEPANAHRARANPDRWFYPEPLQGTGAAEETWRALLSVDATPWALRDPNARFRWRRAPEVDGIVIELRQNNNAEGQTIAAALAEFEAALRAERPHNIVLDMRMNGGGDLNTTRDFMRSLPQRAPGRIFVLTSPWTFSAAVASIGYLEQAAPSRVTIVGETVGDRLNFFSEGDVVQLPNSGIALLNATERHDYQTGCRGFSDCHGPVVRHPIAVRSLAPDIAAPWTIEAYRAGRDPAMEAVAAALH
jgi:hypothetical protein